VIEPARLVRASARRLTAWMSGLSPAAERCAVCGVATHQRQQQVLWPALIETWELSPAEVDWVDDWEGRQCLWCGASRRSHYLAATICHAARAWLGSSAGSLRTLCRDSRFRQLEIAEINSAGSLHRYLRRCPHLRYSEFNSTSPAVPHEDLSNLSYPDQSLDLVITSETLEHVPDVDRALAEIRRTLKPEGRHIFTTPVCWERQTRQRAASKNGDLIHLLPPSYHGSSDHAAHDFLVVYEFGADFVDRCRRAGFGVEVMRHPVNPMGTAFVTWPSEPASLVSRF